MKLLLSVCLLLISCLSNAQYIGVKARYTATRLVDDAPNPPKRENRLILSFYEVSPAGVYTPTTLSNYDIWVYKQGLQFGNVMGGVLDSTGNNYPGYNFTAPKVVSYYNSLGTNYIDCDPNAATHYVVNGQELDCGFITVSYWDMDYGTMVPFEAFSAPNVCLPLYPIEHPYYFSPGNVNFSVGSVFPGPPYNMYNFFCGSGTLQLVVRGLLPRDSSGILIALPVRFENVQGRLVQADLARISWSNYTEIDISHYEIEVSTDNISFTTLGSILPISNVGSRSDYIYTLYQSTLTASYRIKAVENNGQSFYSRIVFLKKQENNSFQNSQQSKLIVFPNPVSTSDINFRLTSAPPGRYIASLITPEGNHTKFKLIEHPGGDLNRQLNMDGLSAGVYQLILQTTEHKFTQRVLYVR